MILNIPDPKSIENVKLDKKYSLDRDASIDFLQFMIDLVQALYGVRGP
jgi:hypothetical protein